MIPKIIHYSWFSGEPFPDFIEDYMKSWRVHLADYEFILWDAERLKALDNTFANEAVSVHKWAFAADYVRLRAVHDYGGIWLDTDVEMFKNFDAFLSDSMFIGREYYVSNVDNEEITYLTSHCFGAERGHPFIKECLEFYENRHFIRSQNENMPQQLRYDMTIIPLLQAQLSRNYGFDWRNSNNQKQVLSNGVCVYPYQYFDQPGYTNMDNVVCIHRVAQSWNPKHPNRVPSRTQTDPKRRGLKYYLRFITKPLANFLSRI